jgi:hypothetical protein
LRPPRRVIHRQADGHLDSVAGIGLVFGVRVSRRRSPDGAPAFAGGRQ